MSENLIKKITSEVSSYYTIANQYRPDNDIAFRAKLRRTIQSKLQPYVDDKLIISYTVICDESNNNTHNVKQPVKLDVFIKITKSSPQHIISLPVSNTAPPQQMKAPKSGSLWDSSIDTADSLWNKLFGKRK